MDGLIKKQYSKKHKKELMSNLSKDDFHDLLLDLISLARDYDTSTQSKLIEIEELYQLATDGREELEKENERMKLTIKRRSESMIDMRKFITALQSQCTEKDQEMDEQHKMYNGLLKQFAEKEKECEELRSENEALKSCVREHDKELQEAFKEGQNSIGHAGHW